MRKQSKVLLLLLLLTFTASSVSAEPFLSCDSLPTTPVVEFYTITGTWVSPTGVVTVEASSDSCKFDLSKAPIGINKMSIASCSYEHGCSFPKEFTLYKTKGWAFTKDKKTYTIKEQWVVREEGVVLQ